MSDERFEERVERFLKAKRIAIWGVADSKSDPGWSVANRLRKRNIDVIAVNPGFEDDPEQKRASSLTRIDPPVDAVLFYVDRPQTSEAVDDCLEAGTGLVWLHDALSKGSAVPKAIERLESAGCDVIPGLCPMFFLKPVDPAHFCLKWILRFTGKTRRVCQVTH